MILNFNENASRPITYDAHLMPAPSPLPWASCQMPWTNSGQMGVMQFGGDFFLEDVKHVAKRKADEQLPRYTQNTCIIFFRIILTCVLLALHSLHKRHITDEVMANQLNGLHISRDYTTHQQQQSSSSASWEDAMSIESEPTTSAASNSRSSYITMSTQDFEQKLKNANSITICEQISKMHNEPVLPQSLLDRIERPCLAVVLWQAPMRGNDPVVAGPSRDCIIENNNNNDTNSKVEDDDCIVDDLLDNNNSSSVDLNSSMDMDL